jgi:hypothetical protein
MAEVYPRPLPEWVNLRHSPGTPATSEAGGEADENDAKADMPAAMSAVEGRADIVCQELSGPFLARRWYIAAAVSDDIRMSAAPSRMIVKSGSP